VSLPAVERKQVTAEEAKTFTDQLIAGGFQFDAPTAAAGSGVVADKKATTFTEQLAAGGFRADYYDVSKKTSSSSANADADSMYLHYTPESALSELCLFFLFLFFLSIP
jgi:hypothetical protein